MTLTAEEELMLATILGIVVKLAIIIIPAIATYYASKKTRADRMTLFYSLAEMAWKEIEAWKQGLSEKPTTTETENKFILSVMRMAESAKIAPTLAEQNALREWARSRSIAGKYKNGTGK